MPWTVIFGAGTAALETGEQICDLVRCGGVTAQLVSIDEYTPSLLQRRPGLVLVLPEQPHQTGRAAAARFRPIVSDYRLNYPDTVRDGFRPDSHVWQQVGVLQVCYTELSLADEVVRALLGLACARHLYSTEPGTEFKGDLFAVFNRDGVELAGSEDEVKQAELEHWRIVRQWGVHEPAQAREIRAAIVARCQALEDPSKRALYRPIPDVDLNRLKLALYCPGQVPPELPNQNEDERLRDLRNFRDNGARVVRELVADLKTTFRYFGQPVNKANRRDAQKHFFEFFTALRIICDSS